MKNLIDRVKKIRKNSSYEDQIQAVFNSAKENSEELSLVKHLPPKKKNEALKKIQKGKLISEQILNEGDQGSLLLKRGENSVYLELVWKGSGSTRTSVLDAMGCTCDCPDHNSLCKHKIAIILLGLYLEKKAIDNP